MTDLSSHLVLELFKKRLMFLNGKFHNGITFKEADILTQFIVLK